MSGYRDLIGVHMVDESCGLGRLGSTMAPMTAEMSLRRLNNCVARSSEPSKTTSPRWSGAATMYPWLAVSSPTLDRSTAEHQDVELRVMGAHPNQVRLALAANEADVGIVPGAHRGEVETFDIPNPGSERTSSTAFPAAANRHG